MRRRDDPYGKCLVAMTEEIHGMPQTYEAPLPKVYFDYRDEDAASGCRRLTISVIQIGANGEVQPGGVG